VDSSTFDTLARELKELRAENDRLHAELATTQRLRPSPRGVRFPILAAWLIVLAVAGGSARDYASSSLDAKQASAHNEACWAKLGAGREALSEISRRFHGRLAVQAVTHAIDRCRQTWPTEPTRCAAIDWDWWEGRAEDCVCR
jgi:hypothetical protein